MTLAIVIGKIVAFEMSRKMGQECNTSGVLNIKNLPCHHMHCKAFGHMENFDMHSLKQVYIYDMSVALYGLN